MKNTLKCPHCGKEIEVTDALTHQIEEKVLMALQEKHQIELASVKKTAEEKAKETLLKDLKKKDEEILEVQKKARDEQADAVRKATKTFEDQLTRLEKEKDEQRLDNKKLRDQIDELLSEIRKLRQKDEERELDMKKKLIEEEDKIRIEVRKKAEEEHQLKDFEKDKKLSDALKQIEELKTKITQGSQQSQGEVLELSLESKLKLEFPSDNVSEVKKGVRGADILQEVFDKLGRSCGTILWESKNAQWSEGWIIKLKEDQRQAKADIAILVSVNLPPGIESFAYKEGVWVCSWKHFLPLAWTIRYSLVSVYHERQSAIGKDEKMRVLYQYLTGKDFRHRVEAIVEAFSTLQEDLEKEKRYFNIKWAKQDKEIRKVIDHTHGMWGDFQAVIGKSLPEIKTLELDSGEDQKAG